MNTQYTIWYRWGNTKKELEKQEWIGRACFSNLSAKSKDCAILFQAEFKNEYDKFKHKGEHSTKEWLEEFILSDKARSGIVEVNVEEDYYYITLDMSILSYQWVFSILTLFRYPGEYYNICWNYWKVKERWPKLNQWEALYLAHQGTFYEEYGEIFETHFYYNMGHSLFKAGQTMSQVEPKKILDTLDKYPPYLSSKFKVGDIQPIWGYVGYAERLNFDVKNVFRDTHVDKELE